MRKTLFVLLAVISLFSLSFPQSNLEKIKMEFEVTIDNVGNAKIVYKQSATAAQWKILNQVYGQNPALLKRDIMKELSAYELYNFDFKKDDMNRTFILTFKAKGVARYKGNGIWDMEIEKTFSPKKISDRDWYLTSTETMGNVLYESHFTVKLPEGVKKSEITTDEFGKQVLRYQLPLERKMPIYLILGAVFAVLGIGLVGASFIIKPKQ